MKKTIIALTAVLMTSGIALAQNTNSVIQTAHDAAPVSVVVKQPANIDYSSQAAISSTVGATNEQQRAAIIQERADNR
ncbi:hypothetical protein G6N74_01535 [Mesorhizobium sp. CGMCC 1.15528]|uniref:DUF4148 domain-containing protein n=1 Tax=Mesorhizobium zhangyense TaxID=1776730 RepID=A0A7C9R507_9HYPH|nr:hypothetical protein [Mesorhizobium zhangyense]NGN39738.1 hypothetical protein [Mesorhizobium zhangyense]